MSDYPTAKKEKKYTNKTYDIRSPRNIVTFDVRNIIRILVLIGSDVTSILLGWQIAQNAYVFLLALKDNSYESLLSLSILSISISLLVACQAYTRGVKSRNYVNIFKAITLTYLALIPTSIGLYGKNYLVLLFISWSITIILINSFRWAFFKILLYLRQQCYPLKIKVMLVGEQEDLEKCLILLKKNKEFIISNQLNLSKFTDLDRAIIQFEQTDLKKVDEILICSWEKIKESKKFLCKLRCSGIYWRILKLEEPIKSDNIDISNFEGMTALRIIKSSNTGVDFLTKRIFDTIAAFILLIIFSLPMLAIALLIKIDSPGKVFYSQTRVGLKGIQFKILKFRTMVQNASQLQQQLEAKNEINGGVLFKMKNDPRITRIGKFLRKYSLDELPQLFNVLRGEMSLVGPRPLPVRDVERFAPEHYFRHEVLPGITGLWQVSGRSDIDSKNVFNLDFEYIENWSLALDLEILLRTIEVVLKSKGAY